MRTSTRGLAPDGGRAGSSWKRDDGTNVWGKGRRENRRTLLLTEVALLRRMVRDEGTNKIARELNLTPSSVSSLKKKLREAFGVDTNDELLAHPEVREQIKE